jgi:Isochorismatase family
MGAIDGIDAISLHPDNHRLAVRSHRNRGKRKYRPLKRKWIRTGVSLDETTREALAANRRNSLIIAGFATEAVVLHAATAAIAAGHRVLIPVDACGGLSERTEAAALRQIEAFGGETTSVVTLATALVPDFSSALGQRLFNILQQLRLA